jgi:hypothetical protein
MRGIGPPVAGPNQLACPGTVLLRLLFDIALAVVVALVVGIGSAWYAVDRGRLFGTVTSGEWTAWTSAGSAAPDPYSTAAMARSGEVPLGAGEGIAFTADTDSSGSPLAGSCAYVLVGQTPPARLWTLTVYDAEGRLPATTLKRSGFSSQDILRREDGSFEINLSTEVQPGNWLEVPSGRFRLTLRLYDAPLAVGTALSDINMPHIVRGRCR